MSLPYRPEIDGLRALAVLAIVSFHAEVPWIGGGFLGVDVFFVISGYLITRLLLADRSLQAGWLARFYERRARRILPALLVSLILGLPFAWWSLTPPELRHHAAAIGATLGFASNLFYWRERGYFDSASELDPLIHTWSLAVEEQFYLFFPLLLAALWRRGAAAVTLGLAALVTTSLAVALWGSATHPFAAFYLLPTRGWELALGALVAAAEWRRVTLRGPAALRRACEVTALAAILLSFTLLDRHHATPGPTTVIPVLATAALILSTRDGSPIHRLLCWRPLTWVGRCSFSLYLLHQPALAYSRLSSSHPPSTVFVALLMLSTAGAAWLSWRWIERPCRDARRVPLRSFLLGVSVGVAALVVFAASVILSDGLPSRFSASQREIFAQAGFDFRSAYRWGTCLVEAPQWRGDPPARDCAPSGSSGSSGLSVVVIGDSHAAALASGFRRGGATVGQYTVAACPPNGREEVREHPGCRAALQRGIDEIGRLRPTEVWVQFSWRQYADHDPAGRLDDFLRQLSSAAPGAALLVIGNVPHWYPDLPRRAAREIGHWQDGARLTASGISALRRLDAELQTVSRRHGARFLAPIDRLCEGEQCLVMAAGDTGDVGLTAWDDAHLTDLAAQRLIRAWSTAPLPQPEATAR